MTFLYKWLKKPNVFLPLQTHHQIDFKQLKWTSSYPYLISFKQRVIYAGLMKKCCRRCWCVCVGMSIEGVRLPSCVAHDAVDERRWETVPCKVADGVSSVGDAQYRDTGWQLD
jgi:hypothetical protein